jgi:hypothetical protein
MNFSLPDLRVQPTLHVVLPISPLRSHPLGARPKVSDSNDLAIQSTGVVSRRRHLSQQLDNASWLGTGITPLRV